MKNKIRSYYFMKVHWILAFVVVVFVSFILAFIGWVFYLFDNLSFKKLLRYNKERKTILGANY